MDDLTPAALIDLEDIAGQLGLRPAEVRRRLEAQRDPPVATYRGRPLWLSDVVHDLAAEPTCAPV